MRGALVSRTILFIGSNTTGTGESFARVARRRAFAVELLVEEPARHAWAAELGVRVHRTETSDFAAVLGHCRAAAGRAELAAITSTSDGLLPTAARAARELGLPGPDPDTLAAAGDKVVQRRAFTGHNVPSPAWTTASSPEQVVEALERLGGRAVVKPVRGSGSVGTRLVEDSDGARHHARELLGGLHTGRTEACLLVEEYVEGEQFSVELFGGEAIGITRNYLGPPPSFVEIGHDFPAVLDPVRHDALAEAAVAAVRALDVTWGPAHVEIRVGSDGPKVIEVNARLAGGMIPELVRLAGGVDLVEATLAAWLGEVADLESRWDRAASLRAVLALRRGRLEAVEAFDESSCVRFLAVRRAGDLVGGFGDFRDRVGYVIASAHDVQGSAAAAIRAVSQVRVHLAAPTVDGR